MTRLIRIKNACERLGLARSSYYYHAKAGRLPMPIKQGQRASAVREDELEAAIERMTAERDAKVAAA